MRALSLALASLLALCAIPVGLVLCIAPDGHLVGVTTDLLRPGLPFSTYLLPGLALLGPIGGGAVWVLVLVGRRSRAAPLATALLGVVVMIWIALQLVMIRAPSPLHAITFAVGAALSVAGASGGAGLWLRWVGANAAGELAGLGLMALAVALAAPHLAAAPGLAVLPGVLALGALEGLAVGAAQAGVLRRAFPRFRSRAWIAGTIAGAVTGWLLGMLPSLLLGGGDAPPSPIDDRLQMVLAAALGLVAGPILAAFQLPELRRHVRRAPFWLLANAAAWAAGMPIIFVAAGSDGGALRIATFLASAGAIVGAIHGLALLILRPIPTAA